MSKFLTGKELEDRICDIIWEAKSILMIVSPYIRLDDYFKKLIEKHKNNPKIHLLLVFGKNENDAKKSMSKNDFDFFTKFLNVSIIYVPNLHAKYYGNEKKGVITSINFYDYSFKKNIEFGVFSEQNFWDRFTQSADNDAWDECVKIANNNEVVFIKRPVYENQKIIINLGKNYIQSDILFDSTEKFYGDHKDKNIEHKKLQDFPTELELGSTKVERPQRESEKIQTHGFCIRTGRKIKFNPKQPMSKESWIVWKEYGNFNHKENYCHKTGKQSHGNTSMRNPIL